MGARKRWLLSRDGKIFTLLHEYGHLLLTASDPMHDKERPHRIEDWCNAFAGAVLVPEPELRKVVHEQWKRSEQDLDTGLLWSIANRFRVSPQTILRRMRSFEMIERNMFYALNGSLSASQNERTAVKESKGGPAPYRLCLYEKGKLFVSLVLEGKDRGVVDHAEYLSLNLKHLDTVESLVGR